MVQRITDDHRMKLKGLRLRRYPWQKACFSSAIRISRRERASITSGARSGSPPNQFTCRRFAATLSMNPEVILLDEPTSALDPTMVGEVETVIQDLAKTGKTMIIVTHELAFARAICNRAFFMDDGEIYEKGPPEQVFDNPQREKTRRFVRRSKSLKLDITSRDYDFIRMLGEIDLYCRKNQLQSRQANRTRPQTEGARACAAVWLNCQ